jgi:uncharacterized protein YndB with AHSA1/START domain
MYGSLTHSRFLPVPPSAVFAAYADPRLRFHWFRIPSDQEAAFHELEFRVGGSETARGRFAPFGVPETVEYCSRFSEIVPDERIVFTYELLVDARLRSVSLASVGLEPEAGGTRHTCGEHYLFVARTRSSTCARGRGERQLRIDLQATIERLMLSSARAGGCDSLRPLTLF